jgi:hypothetical protein
LHSANPAAFDLLREKANHSALVLLAVEIATAGAILNALGVDYVLPTF